MNDSWLWGMFFGFLVFIFMLALGYVFFLNLKGGDIILPESLYWLYRYL